LGFLVYRATHKCVAHKEDCLSDLTTPISPYLRFFVVLLNFSSANGRVQICCDGSSRHHNKSVIMRYKYGSNRIQCSDFIALICRGFVVTTCCSTNLRQIESVELNLRPRVPPSLIMACRRDPPPDSIRAMMFVWKLRAKIIETVLCCIVLC